MKKSHILLTLTAAIIISAGSANASSVFSPSAHPVGFFGWFKSKEEKAADTADTQPAEAAAAEAEAATAEAEDGIEIEELKKQVVATLALINSKRDELEAVTNALKAIPLPEQMSAKAREYQTQVSNLMAQINDLREQANGYIAQLEEMGVPVDQWLE